MVPGYQIGPAVLQGCCLESERASLVVMSLQGLRNSIPESLHPHLDGLIGEIRPTARYLRDVADKAQVHLGRVPQIIDYLNIILPCLSRTLRDITSHYEDTSRHKESRWRAMYHKMSNELPGTTLPARFIMYNQFLNSLRLLLSRSPNFDLNALEALKTRILQLREVRQIPPPTLVVRTELIRRGDIMDDWVQPHDAHWAESIFTLATPTRSPFKRSSLPYDVSKAYGPLDLLGHLPPMLPDAKILLKKSFDHDRLSVIFFLQGQDRAPHVFVRAFENSIQPWAAYRGVHELVIKRERENDAILKLTRWSNSERRSKLWARLQFATWEELVLFQYTFVALKASSKRTISVHPDEYFVEKEMRLFQAQIIDDEYNHSLVVFEDLATKGIRLHVAVGGGEMRHCPVWTAFIKPNPRIIRKSRHKIWMRDVQPYVFNGSYRARNQRRGRHDAFEIRFLHTAATDHFLATLKPPPPPPSSSEPAHTATEESDDALDPGVD